MVHLLRCALILSISGFQVHPSDLEDRFKSQNELSTKGYTLKVRP